MTLQETIENLYSVFARYPFRLTMPCCIPHCFSLEEIAQLDSKPLHQLTSEDLSSFAADLLLTCGEIEDFKHFLPRVFELSIQNQFIWPDPEVVFGKLQRADWETWPELEQQAVQEVLMSWWKNCLADSSNLDINTVLAALMCAEGDVLPYLDIWLRTPTPEAAIQLARFVINESMNIWLGKSFNAFVPSRYTQILKQWLLLPETKTYLEDAFFHYSDHPKASQISIAVQILEG